MIQAARSGKQNIVEGTVDKATSYEMAIKLINVARASLKELLEDYKDYLRVNGHTQWSLDSKEVDAMRRLGTEHTESEYFVALAESRTADVIANMVVVLLYQADTLLMRYIASIEAEFKAQGGVKEKMHAVRMEVKQRG
jgi:four helix bundle suffix protein